MVYILLHVTVGPTDCICIVVSILKVLNHITSMLLFGSLKIYVFNLLCSFVEAHMFQ